MKRPFFIISTLLLFLFFLAFFVWQGIYLPKEKASREEIFFLVKRGEGVKEIADNLEDQGVIKSSIFFRIYTALSGEGGNLKAGLYTFSKDMPIPEIMGKMVRGKIVKIKVTIPEGFTLKEIEERINSRFHFQKGEAQYKIEDLKVADFQNEFSFLKDAPKEATLEGFLFPDTYEFGYEMKVEKIVRKMLENFDKKLLEEIREEIGRQKKTIFEIIIMASLLEKEVRTFEDKKLVSGILWKRLKIGMPLQVDATITYITGKKTTKISLEETKIESPYNTYKYSGLPKGPICNPGLESILAAVYPESSDYLYYLSRPDGKTIFSKTLEEHNIAKAKYL